MISSVPDDIAPVQPHDHAVLAGPAEPRTLVPLLSQRELAAEVRRVAGGPAMWVSRVRLDPEGRRGEQMHLVLRYVRWLFGWLCAQSPGVHARGRGQRGR